MPDTIASRIEFYRSRIAQWEANAAALGLSPSSVTALKDAINEAEEAYQAAIKSRETAKSATVTQRSKVGFMSSQGSDAVRFIRAFAESRPTPEARDAVYALADVAPPTPPSALPAPNQPVELNADPNADGTVTLRWKATGNSGSVYFVMRKVGNNTQWQQLAITNTKRFVDAGVPAGTPSVMYQVRAQRGVLSSPPSQPASVQFGTGGAIGFQGGNGIGLAA